MMHLQIHVQTKSTTLSDGFINNMEITNVLDNISIAREGASCLGFDLSVAEVGMGVPKR